jgi:hypothetical protein
MVSIDVVANRLPRTPLRWGRRSVRFLRRLVWKNSPVAAWKMQAMMTTPTLIALLATQASWQVYLIMLGWALVATVIYELALRLGVEDFLVTSTKGLAETVNHGIRMGAFGWKAIVVRAYHDRGSRRLRPLVHLLVLVGNGVVVTHYHFYRSGFSPSHVFGLNLLGRATSVLFTVSMWAAIWFFVGDYVTWVFDLFLDPIRAVWHHFAGYLPQSRTMIAVATIAVVGLFVLDELLDDETEEEPAVM